MYSLRRPSPAGLARLTASQADRELMYTEHGATAGSPPAGYHHDQWEAGLGAYHEAAATVGLGP
jgi:hypothetical protein